MDVQSPEKEGASSIKLFIGFLWIISLVVTGFIGYSMGQGGKTDNKTVLASETQPQITVQPTPIDTPTIIPVTTCPKSGFAQKWEYLTAYTIKEGDTIQSIVTTQLHDANRVNEVMQLNGPTQLVVGSTLYLPPPTITKSTGNLQLVSGRLVKKDTVNWQLSFNGDKDGQGILIPSFWFGDIADKDNYHVGDCVTILFDNTFKVFSVTRQS